MCNTSRAGTNCGSQPCSLCQEQRGRRLCFFLPSWHGVGSGKETQGFSRPFSTPLSCYSPILGDDSRAVLETFLSPSCPSLTRIKCLQCTTHRLGAMDALVSETGGSPRSIALTGAGKLQVCPTPPDRVAFQTGVPKKKLRSRHPQTPLQVSLLPPTPSKREAGRWEGRTLDSEGCNWLPPG